MTTHGGSAIKDAVMRESLCPPDATPAEAAARHSLTYPQHIHVLTSLRFFAAAWVVFFHFKEYLPESGLKSNQLLAAGNLGVDFFFILSGFVLAHAYLAKAETGHFDYWDFVSKRIARVYPMHLITLFAFIAFGLLAHKMGWHFREWGPDGWLTMTPNQIGRAVFAHLTLIQAWGSLDVLSFNMPSWSISAEWFAYLLFPVSTLLLSARQMRPWIGVAAAVALFVAMNAAVHEIGLPGLLQMTGNIGALRIFPEFLLGLALYRLGRTWSLGLTGARIAFSVAILAAIGIALAGMSHAAVVLALGAIILFGADAERAGGLRPFAHAFPVLLGEISYSVYMVHFGVGIVLFELIIPDFRTESSLVATIAISGALALATLLSYATYRLIELPARNLIVSGAKRLNRLPPDRPHT